MQYHVVFDVTQTGYRHWSYLAYSAIAIVAGVWLLCYNRRPGWRSAYRGNIRLGLVLAVFGIGGPVVFALSYHDYLKLQSALRESQCQVAEGIVTNFHLVAMRRHTEEVFYVGGRKFQYWQGSGQNGFHQSGIIRDGLQVRINFVGQPPDIARLEIAR